MELESVTKVNSDDYYKLFRFVNLKAGWKKLLTPVMLILVVIMIIQVIIMESYSSDPLILLELIMAMFLVFILLNLWFFAPRTSYKASEKLYSNNYYFVWHKEHFTKTVNAEDMAYNSDTKYINLVKVFEVQDYLYLFVSKSLVEIIPKDSFTKGSWNELSDILKANLGNRYKTYR